jgi:hypothetical protein
LIVLVIELLSPSLLLLNSPLLPLPFWGERKKGRERMMRGGERKIRKREQKREREMKRRGRERRERRKRHMKRREGESERGKTSSKLTR